MSSYEEAKAKMKADHDAFIAQYEREVKRERFLRNLIFSMFIWLGLWAVFLIANAVIK